MPYKHIAAHLKKTELACRLHYHQLSHGSHRRKRTASTSTASSNSSSSSKHSLHQQYQLPSLHGDGIGFQTPMHGSPNGYHLTSPEKYTVLNQSPGRVHHKVLLPKPRTITPDESPNHIHGLRIDTTTNGLQPSSVDADRLHSIYNNRRSSFWAAIAADYGPDVSPAQLEDIWRHNTNSIRRPPTPPGHSPNDRVLRPSPFPNYHTPASTAIDTTKDYGPVVHPTGVIPSDRLQYQLATQQSAVPYDQMPYHLPRMDRQPSWSNHSGVPATAITALLTEDKCPRHAQYCIGGRCISNH
jgi:hypothetical protein